MSEAPPERSQEAQELLIALVSKGRMMIPPEKARSAHQLMSDGLAATWGVPGMMIFQATQKAFALICQQERDQDDA